MPDSHSAVVRPSGTGRREFADRIKLFACRSRATVSRLGAHIGTKLSDLAPATARASSQPAVGHRAFFAEPLEDRQLMSVVYVSTSGNDHNSGHATTSPVASLTKAVALLKTGDTMLLKCGDSWNQAIGNVGKSNVTFASYGSGAKPKVSSSTSDGLAIIRASNVTVRGISFVGTGGTSRNGIVSTGGNGNITIDSCDITGFRFNVTMQGYFGPIKGLKIINSTITHANGIGKSSGMYADNVQGITLQNDVFDHNGGVGSIFNQGAYITATCSNLYVSGCTFSYSANVGLQARCGGTVTGCTFSSNNVGLTIGLVNGAGEVKDGGVTISVTNNLFTGVAVGLNNGYGMEVGNVKSGTINGNRFINGPGKKYGYAISLERGTASGKQVGIENLTIFNNVAQNWGSHVINVSSGAGLRSVTMFNNKL